VSDVFPIQNNLKQGDALSQLLFTLLQNIASGRSKKMWGRTGIEWNTSATGLCWRC